MPKNLELVWVVQLRWVALVCQSLLVLAVAALTPVDVPIATLLGLNLVGAASNAALLLARRRTGSQSVLIGTALAFDVALLTAGLYASGGPMNPFSFLYVVPVALGAVVLSARLTFGLCVLAIGGYGLLYATASDDPMHHASMQLHLEGMWVAMAFAAILVAYFVVSLQKKLRAQEEELELARDRSARYDKLASMTTLAAGAAHELATPLSTIAVTARELELSVSDPELAREANIISQEVKRCRSILNRLSSQSGDRLGDAMEVTDLRELVDGVLARSSLQPRVGFDGQSVVVNIPVEPVVEAISALVQNALDAGHGAVTVSLETAHGQAVVRVENDGPQIPPEVLSRVFEPFYSTKDTPERMGLGLFVARKVAEQLGGSLTIESATGKTTATFTIPETR